MSIFVGCSSEAPSKEKETIVSTTPKQTKDIIPPMDSLALNYPMIKRLQGQWGRDQPPFGKIEFNHQMVRFIPAGKTPFEPTFEPFQIAATCPYGEEETTAGMGDFFVLPMGKECLIMVLGDKTLTLRYTSGEDMVYYKED